jgi:ribosome modulation factor
MGYIEKKFRKYGIENGGTMLVPAEYSHEQQMAFIFMCEAGYTCNAAAEGFRAGVSGRTWKDQPYSIITNIIENRRWAEGFERGRNIAAKAAA